MPSPYSDHFTDLADIYKVYRPTYPESVFRYLRGLVGRNEVVWDCACGSGQATSALAKDFARVIATDISMGQLREAPVIPNVSYAQMSAEQSGLRSGSIDLILVAQALHWFHSDSFNREVLRVARKPAVFAALTYGLFTIDDTVDGILYDFYEHVLGGYWPRERRHVDNRYGDIPMPSNDRVNHEFTMSKMWNRRQLTGFFATWSAVRAYRKATNDDPLPTLEDKLSVLWPDPDEKRLIRWPLTVISCIIA